MNTRLDFGILLALAYATFAERLNDALRDAGFDDIGAAYGYVFRALDRGPLTLSELAAKLDMTTQGAAKIINAMEAGDYVARRPHADDARAKLLVLTARGRSALATAREFHHDFEARLAREQGAQRAATVRSLLTTMVGGEQAGEEPLRLLRPM